MQLIFIFFNTKTIGFNQTLKWKSDLPKVTLSQQKSPQGPIIQKDACIL